MSTVQLVMLGLIGVSFLLTFTELILFALLWPPYIQAMAHAAPTTLPGSAEALAATPAESREVKLRPASGGVVLFRRTFGMGKGRPMYLGVLRPGADGTIQLTHAPFPALGHIPMAVAFGAFGGLTFGGGSAVVGVIFGAVFAFIMRFNRRAARRLFAESGPRELERIFSA